MQKAREGTQQKPKGVEGHRQVLRGGEMESAWPFSDIVTKGGEEIELGA